ncbi:SulP family inorganic anion transporter [Ferriphaselus sp. R-1]|uniref:SulP family inorganic anion transporter n=1 Tax=Ferriphaselus sp. R-1 TaxID=1485544 RepID=UPI00068DF956|nr:SulP family inorganic anion transporter [Ferriphaselus sp. R-1]
MNKVAPRLLPFLSWWPLRGADLRADLIAGITVALVLIPQSMAYAQLAGMPAYYGLYAAFLPGMVAAMWGSSAHLATGPVAVVALLTASALAPLAASGSVQFIVLAVALALLVGLIQLALGVFRLGVVVSFLSHPVIVGFTNAAAIIIALSQVNKLFGISIGRSEHFLQDVWGMLQQVGDTHLPTLMMGLGACVIMLGMKRYTPRLPNVLVAVVLATLVSWATGYERNSSSRIDYLMDGQVRLLADEFMRTEARIAQLRTHISQHSAELQQFRRQGENSQRVAAVRYEIELLQLELSNAEQESRKNNRSLRRFVFEQVPAHDGIAPRLYLRGQVPAGERSDGYRWRIGKVKDGELKLIGGGEVVGSIPSGLPELSVPVLHWSDVGTLLSSALVIALVGFMEAISIAKAMAARTRQRIDPNQELIGQGLANIVGSFSQAFPVSGSFSRSAVNLNSGGRSGMSSVFASLLVLSTLLFLTPLLYHLPQAVLAAIIIMAVLGLVNLSAMRHAWQVHRHDGIAASVTFVATLAFAPHLDNGILLGAAIAIGLFLYRTMQPRVARLGRHADGTLRDVKVYPEMPTSAAIVPVRFDGQLYFANVGYFEDAVLEAVADKPRASHVLVVGNGINNLDASGEQVVRALHQRLRANGVRLVFSGLKKQVLDVMRRTGLLDEIGADSFYPDEDRALTAICDWLGEAGGTDPFHPDRKPSGQ